MYLLVRCALLLRQPAVVGLLTVGFVAELHSGRQTRRGQASTIWRKPRSPCTSAASAARRPGSSR